MPPGPDLEERFYAQQKFTSDIWLAEYEQASRTLDADVKAFLWATNITTILAPLIWFFGYSIHIEWSQNALRSEELSTITTVFLLFSIIFSFMSIMHVANSRKSRVIAERKIILLRRAKGIRYSDRSLILPSWRIEGADNPFGLKLYPGLLSYASFSIFLLSAFPALSIALLFDNVPLGRFSPKEFELAHPSQWALFAGVIWMIFGTVVFRYNLREQSENCILWLSRIASRLARIPLFPNIEYKLYRCKLEIAEATRVGARMEIITPFALAIEDQTFFRHCGVSLRGSTRAVWGYLWKGKRSGGSTITQQCVRTHFILRYTPRWRRKIVEVFLAFWLDSVLSKNDVLQIYLTTVRFDKNVNGFHRAIPHFFPNEGELDKAMSFILIERLANSSSLFYVDRIQQLLKRLKDEDLLAASDVTRVGKLYGQLIASGVIKKQGTGLNAAPPTGPLRRIFACFGHIYRRVRIFICGR